MLARDIGNASKPRVNKYTISSRPNIIRQSVGCEIILINPRNNSDVCFNCNGENDNVCLFISDTAVGADADARDLVLVGDPYLLEMVGLFGDCALDALLLPLLVLLLPVIVMGDFTLLLSLVPSVLPTYG